MLGTNEVEMANKEILAAANAETTGNRFLARFDLEGFVNPDAVPDNGTRGRLLTEAVKLFAVRGYDACTMKDLAKAINVGAPAIYNYYSSKNELLIAATDQVLCTFYQAILGDLEQTDPTTELFTILRRHSLFCTGNRTSSRAADALLNADFMARELPPPSRQRFLKAMKTYLAIIAELLEKVVGPDPKIDASLRAFMVHEIIDRAGEWYEPDGEVDPDQIADQCIQLVCRLIGLKTPSRKK